MPYVTEYENDQAGRMNYVENAGDAILLVRAWHEQSGLRVVAVDDAASVIAERGIDSQPAAQPAQPDLIETEPAETQCPHCREDLSHYNERQGAGCNECHAECGHCGADVDRDNLTMVSDESEVCSSCVRRHYRYSDPMRTYVARSDAIMSADTGEYASSEFAGDNWYWDESSGSYYADENNVSANLLGAGANPIEECGGWPKHIRKDALVFGVELEMESKTDNAQSIVDHFGGNTQSNYILKDDGSLSHGAELVTLPMTLAESAAFWPTVCTDSLRSIASARSNCGIHVHVNRAALSALVVGKMLVFLNSPLTRQLVECVAQRTANSYCQRVPKKITDATKRPDDRYQALNLTGKGTVEFRIFASSLKPERLQKAVEFCHAVVMFCRECSIRDTETTAAFLRFLKRERKQYPNLVAFLNENEIAI